MPDTIEIHEQGQKNLQDGDITEERATRFFVVKSSAPLDPVVAAVAVDTTTAFTIPTYFAEHPYNTSYLLKQKRAGALADEAGRFCWEVQCDYSNRIILPLSMPAQIEWDFSEASEEYFFDTDVDGDHADGHPVVNSAGHTFDSIPTRKTGVISATITKNVAVDFDVSLFLSYRQKVNSVSFTVDGVSLDVRQAKVSGASVSPPQLSNGQWYRTAKLVLKFKQTWDDEFADMGYYELSDSGIKGIMKGTPPVQIQKPWPLDGSGHAKTNSTDMPAKLTFKPYRGADYASLSSLLS